MNKRVFCLSKLMRFYYYDKKNSNFKIVEYSIKAKHVFDNEAMVLYAAFLIVWYTLYQSMYSLSIWKL